MLMQYEKIQEAVTYIQNRVANVRANFIPKFGFILGTGLSSLAKEIDAFFELPYAEIPHFPISTVESHAGKLVFGWLEGQPVVAMAGRFHYYEGYSMQEVTFPVRVLSYLGIERLFISAAVGSVNPKMDAGHIVIIRDHINLLPENPLRGKNDKRMGVRFPDMLKAYDKELNSKALALGESLGLPVHQGVYVALPGPNLETPAEYEFMHRMGADVVGMSTVPEVIVARHHNLPVFVVSVVSNRSYPLEDIQETTVEEVIATVERAEPQLARLVKGVLKLLSE
jgi:purine-nucleoside phosphorylase